MARPDTPDQAPQQKISDFRQQKKFFAYRINDNCAISPGYPGWPVCIITHDQIIDEAKMSAFASTEPSAHDWLRCFHEDDFELI
jgi:hypothetical protein